MAAALASLVPAGVTVLAVPVNTPAGGLVRVQDLSGATFFDSSYTRNTASCTLETKLRWKKTKEGPMPFGPKGPKPKISQADSLAAMVAELAAAGVVLTGSLGDAQLQAAIEAVPKEDAKAAAIAAAHAGLSGAAKAIQAETEAEDTAAVNAMNAKLDAEGCGTKKSGGG
jgi:hypothetical protein